MYYHVILLNMSEEKLWNRFDERLSVSLFISAPVTTPVQPFDCRRSMHGCCQDRYTPKTDSYGSNCPGNTNGLAHWLKS